MRILWKYGNTDFKYIPIQQYKIIIQIKHNLVLKKVFKHTVVLLAQKTEQYQVQAFVNGSETMSIVVFKYICRQIIFTRRLASGNVYELFKSWATTFIDEQQNVNSLESITVHEEIHRLTKTVSVSCALGFLTYICFWAGYNFFFRPILRKTTYKLAKIKFIKF